MLTNLKEIEFILKNSHTIAVVGLSPKENRPSNQVARYLQDVGYRIIPVNPGQSEILGEICYPSLLDIPGPVDVVDIFRRPEEVPAVVEQAVRIKAKAVWMQEGIVNDEAARLAREHGLRVVMDRCMKIDHASMV
ncbi:MAG: CoA-binding protein [Desulfobulbaceae bacterium DB1]|nr:MAG: CoA-binding protein [Desulfobulbaceae bacterium DB1]